MCVCRFWYHTFAICKTWQGSKADIASLYRALFIRTVLPTAWVRKKIVPAHAGWPAITWLRTLLQRMCSHPSSFLCFSLTALLLLQESRCWRWAQCRVTTATCCSSGCMAYAWADSFTLSKCSQWNGWSRGTSLAPGASCRVRRPSPC